MIKLLSNLVVFNKIKYYSSIAKTNNQNTMDLIFKKLQSYDNEYNLLIQETMKGEINEFKRQRINQLQPKIHIYKQIQASFTIINDSNNLIKSGVDPDEKQLLIDEINTQNNLLKLLQEEALDLLIEQDEYDDVTQVTVEFRPGIGGSESSLFAEDLMNMIQSYSNLKQWDCRVITLQKDNQIGKGCKLGILQINGENVYSHLKCESGVHKVIRVPETENKGRLHSSTAAMIVLPKVNDTFAINEKDLRIEFMKASGPGGQHVNKTESACRVTHIPTGIQVVNMEDRSQDRNKQRALSILKEKLFAIHVQEKQERMAESRKSQVSGTDRSDKIRTYNFPQERITDHRTNHTLFGMEKMLNGLYLDEFIEKYQEKIHNAKLIDLLEDLQQQ